MGWANLRSYTLFPSGPFGVSWMRDQLVTLTHKMKKATFRQLLVALTGPRRSAFAVSSAPRYSGYDAARYSSAFQLFSRDGLQQLTHGNGPAREAALGDMISCSPEKNRRGGAQLKFVSVPTATTIINCRMIPH